MFEWNHVNKEAFASLLLILALSTQIQGNYSTQTITRRLVNTIHN